jgi:hypothetical protein
VKTDTYDHLNVPGPDTYDQLNVPGPCYLAPQYISTLRFCQPPRSQNPHRSPIKLHQPLINTLKVLDNDLTASYSTLITLKEHSYVRCISSSTEAKVSCDY